MINFSLWENISTKIWLLCSSCEHLIYMLPYVYNTNQKIFF